METLSTTTTTTNQLLIEQRCFALTGDAFSDSKT